MTLADRVKGARIPTAQKPREFGTYPYNRCKTREVPPMQIPLGEGYRIRWVPTTTAKLQAAPVSK